MRKQFRCLSVPFILTLFLSAALSQAQPKRPITFDDFLSIKRVSDPQISPDGKLIAFVVTIVDREANRHNSDIWIVPLAGGEATVLASSPKSDYSPRWSPDGKKIAFLSTRGGSSQIWVISPSGGEARRLTDVSTGISEFIWSPKGTHLAYISSVHPDCPDDDCNKKRNEETDKNPVKARIYNELLFRIWNSWRDGTRSHLFVISTEGGKAQNLTPGDYDTPPIDLGGHGDFSFSADGREIAFVRNEDQELRLGLGTNNDIFLTPLTGGMITKLTENSANDNQPAYSPDGRWIAYRAMARPGFEADKYGLMLYERSTRKTHNLTEAIDYSVQDFLWAPDSGSLFFNAEDKGRMTVFKTILSEKKTAKILEGHYIGSLSLTPDGKDLVFLKQALHRPAEVCSFNLQTKKITQLSHMNCGLLAGLELPVAEEFIFEGAEQREVHGFLLKPPSFDPLKKYPLVMLIHGGPQGAWSDNFHFRWNAQMFASPGYVVAMINFHGSTGYGQAFTDSISGDWGGKPYEDIMRGLDYLLSRFDFIDRHRLGAAGASYGGYLINWIAGHTDRFRCLVSHSGVFDLRSMYGSTEELWFPEWEFKGTPWSNPEQYEKWSPSNYVKNFKTPCLVVHGANDFRVPLCQGIQLFTSLQRMGVPSRFLYFPDEDHFVQKPGNAELWWRTVLEWLATYLK